ncbi:AMP-binding protein [Azospirillum sp. SYSU D00513]|uniref:AMP-binding protein n=1 Tax=Azospirillum sp. SYSU D00513 TaxID=2812561 RepID=UPI001A958AC1|nr:AMP-binding protein [Azospirillum sp. SYSU D00513]
MKAAPPSWIGARARLIEDGREAGWPEIAALADRLEPAFRQGGPVPSNPSPVTALVAALVAAERAGVELRLRRRPGPVAEAGGAEHGFSLLMETSGTTGEPKRVRHDFARLCGRLRGSSGEIEARWLLTYDPAGFAGLQVILTALGSGAALIAAPGAGIAELARLAVERRVTHVSGTPSFWRGFLMALGDDRPPPLRAVTLGGEAADQPLLDRLGALFPDARLRHIYASTEAGALFAVADGRAGFPAAWFGEGVDGVRLRLRDGVLEVLSPRAMTALVEGGGEAGEGGWLSTGDLVEIRGDRALFVGRLDGRVNVGGVKVSPEAVERLLLGVPGVRDAIVRTAANPITGHILTAEVVPEPAVSEADLRARIREAAAALEPAARPRAIQLVGEIPLSAAGKKSRGGTP